MFIAYNLFALVFLSMEEHSAHEPLLSSKGESFGHVNKTSFLVSSAKWILKVTMWVIFIAWASFVFMLPLEYVYELYEKWILATYQTVFGITGSVFLVCSAPILIIAFLSIAHLIISRVEELPDKKTPRFRLWTFPVIVDGPFGVVTAAELIGILLFSVYIIWAVSSYTAQDLNTVSKYQLTL